MSDLDVTKQNLKIVEIMLANGHTGRWDVVRPYVSDDLVLHVPPGLPFGGDYHGWQGYTDVLKEIGAFFSELKGGPKEFATVGNKVVVMGRLSGRIAKNGRAISFPLTDIWELKDGKVVEVTAFYYDTKAISALAEMTGGINAEDERAIVDVLLRYATAIDRRDWQLFASCFTLDVESDYGDIGSWHGRDAIVDQMANGHAKIGPTLHRITNFVIAGEVGDATATCYVDALLMRPQSGEIFRRAHGRYEDRLVRTGEGWKIKNRRFVPVLIQEPAL